MSVFLKSGSHSLGSTTTTCCVSAALLPIPGNSLGAEREDADIAICLVRDESLVIALIWHFEASSPITARTGAMVTHDKQRCISQNATDHGVAKLPK